MGSTGGHNKIRCGRQDMKGRISYPAFFALRKGGVKRMGHGQMPVLFCCKEQKNRNYGMTGKGVQDERKDMGSYL